MEGVISKGAYNWDTKKCFERSYSIGAVVIKICFCIYWFLIKKLQNVLINRFCFQRGAYKFLKLKGGLYIWRHF